MDKIKRNTLKEYADSVKMLDSEELVKEIWMLQNHISLLESTQKESAYFQKFLCVAENERDSRFTQPQQAD